MENKIKIMLIPILTLFLFVTGLSGAEVLKFSQKKDYNIGKGEYLTYNLLFPKYENYTFKSQTKGPFRFRNRGGGKIEVVFDASLEGDKIEKDKLYKRSFTFVHKNIGKKVKVSFAARYAPELYFQDGAGNTLTVEFTPQKKQTDIVVYSSRDFSKKITVDTGGEDFVSLTSARDFKFVKGKNVLQLKLLKEVDMNREVSLFRTIGKRKLAPLKIDVQANGFSPAEIVAEEAALVGEKGAVKADSVGQKTADIAAAVKPVSIPAAKRSVSESGSSDQLLLGSEFVYFAVIAVLFIVIVIMGIKSLVPGKTANSEKYELFYHDVATMLDVSLRGKSIDNSIDEMVLLLLEITKVSKDDGAEQDSLVDDRDSDEEIVLKENESSFMTNLDFFENKQKEIQEMGKDDEDSGER